MSYSSFASVYDRLMEVDYEKTAEYIKALFESYGGFPNTLVDVGCGTGTYDVLFSKFGASVTGVDPSPEMLSIASKKADENNQNIMFVCQYAEELELIEKQDGAVSLTDSLNHIIDYGDFCEALCKISDCLKKKAKFIFDLNSEYKALEVLNGKTFIYDEDNTYLVWQNSPCEDGIIDMKLDFFEKKNGSFERFSDLLSERYYKKSEINKALKKAGLKLLAMYGENTFKSPEKGAQRIYYITEKM